MYKLFMSQLFKIDCIYYYCTKLLFYAIGSIGPPSYMFLKVCVGNKDLFIIRRAKLGQIQGGLRAIQDSTKGGLQ